MFHYTIERDLKIDPPCHGKSITYRIATPANCSSWVLVAIVKKRLNLDASLHTLLQILSVTLFEKMLIRHAVTGTAYKSSDDAQRNQLNLFAF